MATATEYPLIASSQPVKTKLKAFARKIGLRGLGDATYETAKLVVAALANSDWETTIALLSAHTPDEMVIVGNKAIALGADPDTVRTIVGSLATGETIEIIDSKPVIKSKRPWWHYALMAAGGVAAVGGSYYAYKRLA